MGTNSRAVTAEDDWLGLQPTAGAVVQCPRCGRGTHKVAYVCMECNRALLSVHWPVTLACAWALTLVAGALLIGAPSHLGVYLGAVWYLSIALLLRAARASLAYHLALWGLAFAGVYTVWVEPGVGPIGWIAVLATAALAVGVFSLAVRLGARKAGGSAFAAWGAAQVSLALYIALGQWAASVFAPAVLQSAAPGATHPGQLGWVAYPLLHAASIRSALLGSAVLVVLVAAAARVAGRGVPRPAPFFAGKVPIPAFPPQTSAPVVLVPLLYVVIAVVRAVVRVVVVGADEVKIVVQWAARFVCLLAKEGVALMVGVASAIVELNRRFAVGFVVPLSLAVYMGVAAMLLSEAFSSLVLRDGASGPEAFLHLPLVLIAVTAYVSCITRPPLDDLSPSVVPVGISGAYLAMLATVVSVAASLTLWVAGCVGMDTPFHPMNPATAWALGTMASVAVAVVVHGWASSRGRDAS